LHGAHIAEGLPKKGLTSSEALERRKRYGANALPEKAGRSPLLIYLSQFKNPLIYIISIAAIISLLLGQYNDALIIALVILLDSILGFFQEHRAEKTVTALRRLLKPTASLIRDGMMIELDASEIVPDDLVAVNPGDRIPADGELVEAVNVNVNEAVLTGESESIAKDIGDAIYMGTTALSGRGLMKVTGIGTATELGRIAGSLAEIKNEPTPLQIRLESFGKSLTYLVIIVSVTIFMLGIVTGLSLLEMIKVSIVLAIAAIPEGLLIAVTMILVIGMRAILRRKGLVKKLLAVETLGSVTVICTDKTGTLTEGIMRVARTGFSSERMAAYAMALCNDLADSLEVALWDGVKDLGFDPQALSEGSKRVHEVPFTSETKYMLTINLIEGAEIALLKGAPEIILEFCRTGDVEEDEILAKLEDWAGSGLKLIALAFKQGGNLRELKDFTWIGLIGIEDPVRSTVKDAIALCNRAGIKVKMITGDHRATAEKVAYAIGMAAGPDQILEGKQIEAMSESELAKVVDDKVIFYRVAPHHKLKIVSALQSCGEITAMIGDGVNDAPALKKSNIGVSVGNATDVAQETASLILLDSNFKTLVDTVEEGRIIFDNIKKVVSYVLSNSFTEMFVVIGAILLDWPAPLTVAQILWIHLICDGPSDIVLGFERGEGGIMDETPKSIKESFLDNDSKFLIIAISSTSAILSLLLFQHYWQVHNDIILGRTLVFTFIAIEDLVYIFSYRNLRQSIFTSGRFFSNRALFGTVALGFVQQIMAIHNPFLSNLLAVVSLQLADWLLVLSFALCMVGLVEAVKYVARHVKGKHSRRYIRDLKTNLPKDVI
jgi:Ca2+-transporting ATPase